ncbi:hypothetical protein [Streptococcus equi]|uniref:hypothetical protein n=1 Tax=Streptococcus equi TaxID=1336 RepID=UPI001E641402
MNEPIAARVTKPAYNRQQLLKNLESSRLARESSRFKNYVAREKFTTTLAGMSPEDSQRYIQWHKYAKAGLSPSDRVRILEISEKAPKIEYLPGKNSKTILAQAKGKRDSVELYLASEYIETHRHLFDNGVARFQRFQLVKVGTMGLLVVRMA